MVPNPLTPYLAYIRLGLYAAAAAAIVGLVLLVNHWRVKAGEADDVKAAAAAQVAQAMASVAEYEMRVIASQKASEGLQNEIQTLRTARRPAPVVRVCREPARVPASGESGAGRDGAAPAAGELPAAPGPDIGADLYGLADDADEVAARLRACQALVR